MVCHAATENRTPPNQPQEPSPSPDTVSPQLLHTACLRPETSPQTGKSLPPQPETHEEVLAALTRGRRCPESGLTWPGVFPAALR